MVDFKLEKCPLLVDFSNTEIADMFAVIKYSLIDYKKGDLVVCQGDICRHLYILAKGSVKTEMFTEDGGNLAIANITAPYPLASAFLFADDNHFPVDVIAETDVIILKISKDEVMKMFALYPKFLSRYIAFNSNITHFLSSKLQLFTIKTIRGKVSHYLLDLARKSGQHSEKVTVVTDKNQTELAKYFGVARPSLARTLKEMEQDGLIIINRSRITIENLSTLRESI